MHVFDAAVMPPRRSPASGARISQAGSRSRSTAGIAYPSTGDVIDVKTRKIVAELKDETGAPSRARSSSRSTSAKDPRRLRRPVRLRLQLER